MPIRAKHFTLTATLFLFACAHEHASRVPASDGPEPLEKSTLANGVLSFSRAGKFNGHIPAKFCGYLDGAESHWNAVDESDAGYVINVDCKTSAGRRDAQGLVKLERSSLSSSHKGWVSRWRAKASQVQQSALARPYLCFNGKVDAPVCAGSGVTYSELTAVSNITSQTRTFSSWR